MLQIIRQRGLGNDGNAPKCCMQKSAMTFLQITRTLFRTHWTLDISPLAVNNFRAELPEGLVWPQGARKGAQMSA